MTAFVRNRYPLPSENVIANSCVFSHSTGHPHGMVYRRFEHGTVNTPCDEHGTVLASYYATTVCYRILLRHSCENGPPSITVCVAGWSCVFGSAFVVCSPSVLHSFLLVPLETECHVLSGYGSLKGTRTAFRRPI